jgi:hypothetical protein
MTWLPNLLGLVGGTLGLYTFIDTYLFIFKPKVLIGNNIVLESSLQKNNDTVLESITCSIEFCNHRKKYGIIYDVAVRIYRTEAINPEYRIYYASKIIDKIPIKQCEWDLQEFQLFSAVTVVPTSTTSKNIIFSETLFTSTLPFSTYSNYYIEVYYQRKPKGKWHFVDKLLLYNKKGLRLQNEKYITYSVIDSEMTREKLGKSIKPPETSIYRGVTHKISKEESKALYRSTIGKTMLKSKDIVWTLPFYGRILYMKVTDRFLRLPIIKNYAMTKHNIRLQFGQPHLRTNTMAAYENICDHLSELADEINIKIPQQEAKIAVDKKDGYLLIYRNRLTLKMIISGDNQITVGDPNSSIFYSIYFKNSIWNKKHWYLEHDGFIPLESFAIKIMDSFILHSNY